MIVPPAHRTLLLLAALMAIGGFLFSAITGGTGVDAFGGAGLSALLIGAAVLTRTGGHAWLVAIVGTLGGMLVTLIAGLHHLGAAVRWSRIDDPVERTIAVGVAASIAVVCAIGAIAIWRDLPRADADASPDHDGPRASAASARAVARRFRAHGRRLSTGFGAMLIAVGFCAIQGATLPDLAIASLSDPDSSPLVDDPVMQQVLTDPRILHRLRTEPDFRQKVLRMGVPPELLRFALEIADRQFSTLPETPHHPPSLRRQPITGRLLPAPSVQIDEVRRAARTSGTDAPGRLPAELPVAEDVGRAARGSERGGAETMRVLVPDLAEGRAGTGAGTDTDTDADTDTDTDADTNTDTDAGSDASLAVELVHQLVARPVRGETLIETAARRTDFWGTIAVALGGVTMVVGIAIGWGPIRRP